MYVSGVVDLLALTHLGQVFTAEMVDDRNADVFTMMQTVPAIKEAIAFIDAAERGNGKVRDVHCSIRRVDGSRRCWCSRTTAGAGPRD